MKHRQTLENELAPVILTRARNERLKDLEIAVALVESNNTIEDVFNDLQFLARHMKIETKSVPGVRTPIKFSNSTLSLETASPTLGDTVL